MSMRQPSNMNERNTNEIADLLLENEKKVDMYKKSINDSFIVLANMKHKHTEETAELYRGNQLLRKTIEENTELFEQEKKEYDQEVAYRDSILKSMRNILEDNKRILINSENLVKQHRDQLEFGTGEI
ncbi:hypothetical protein BDB01DRAFT_784583 [Pilobolus umbonatus]|nr:hypothetical protein BDB01DRAFT_784583 [Pilobolus umbonatus]